MTDKTMEAAKAWVRYCEKHALDGVDATSAAIALLVRIVVCMPCDDNLKIQTANLLVKTLREAFAENIKKEGELN